MTQAQLAEKMGVSDRAVSKWETGKNMPDSSIMLELCDLLGITVNDLLNGRRIPMENYKEIAEKTILEMRSMKEQNDRLLLHMETLLCTVSVTFLLAMCALAKYLETRGAEAWVLALVIAVGVVQLIPCAVVCLRIEQLAGYYQCKACGEKWVPRFSQVFFAPHAGRTRKMTCPHCGKRVYHKKVVTKDE